MRRVTNKGSWGDSGDFAEYSVFSADGERIGYSCFNSQVRGCGVRTIRLDGSDMKVVMPRPQFTYAWVEDWWRDGRSLVVFDMTADRAAGVWQIPIDGAAPRLLLDRRQMSATAAAHEFMRPNDLRLSPDGRHVAYEMGRQRAEIWTMTGFAPGGAPRTGS